MNNNFGTVIATALTTTAIIGLVGGAYYLGKRQAPQVVQPTIQPKLTATPKPAVVPSVTATSSPQPTQVPAQVKPSQEQANPPVPPSAEPEKTKEDLPSCKDAFWGKCDSNKQSVSTPSPKKEVEKPEEELPSCKVALFGKCKN
jgi:hypothetical protein